MTAALILSTLLACPASPGGSDADRYTRVVADPAIDGDLGRRLCRSLQDEDLHGDCMLSLVGNLSARGEGDHGALCTEVPEGVWRDECYFLAAEEARKQQERELAASRCLQAGRFRSDCGQHLWQSEVRATIAPRRSNLPSFAEAVPRAERIYARWAPLLEEGTDMQTRFWRRFYQNGFERRGWIDLGRCAPLEPAHQDRCIRAGQHLFVQRLDLDLARAGLDLCSLETLVGPAEHALRAAPHPALEDALDKRQAERCGDPGAGGGGQQAPGG